jgi:hypothetical protein
MDVTNHQPSAREGAWVRANREELVERLGRAVRRDGRIYPLNGLMLRRESAPTEIGHGMSYLSFCVIAQGSKEVMLGDTRYRYDPAQYLIATAALPIQRGLSTRPRNDPIWPWSWTSTQLSLARLWLRLVISRRVASLP